jgi:hypothetical protein
LIKRLLTIYYYQVWNKREFRLLPFLFADRCKVNYINTRGGSSIIWRPGDIRQNIENWHQVIPDIKLSIINLICDKQYVTAHFTIQGMHSGELRDTQRNGKYISFEMVEMFRIGGGKIYEQWMVSDVNEILKQITTPGRNSFANQLL